MLTSIKLHYHHLQPHYYIPSYLPLFSLTLPLHQITTSLKHIASYLSGAYRRLTSLYCICQTIHRWRHHHYQHRHYHILITYIYIFIITTLLLLPILPSYSCSSSIQYSTARSFYLLSTTNDKSHTICQNYISVTYTEFYISPNFFLIRTKFSKSQSSSKSKSLRTFYLRLDYPTPPSLFLLRNLKCFTYLSYRWSSSLVFFHSLSRSLIQSILSLFRAQTQETIMS